MPKPVPARSILALLGAAALALAGATAAGGRAAARRCGRGAGARHAIGGERARGAVPSRRHGAAQGALALDADVAFAEPNWIYRHRSTADDPNITSGKQWGMYGATTSPANPYGSGAAAAWAKGQTDCGSVYVGIIDEGYMYTHPDLAPNAGTNVDDDANGYVDDVYGGGFANEDNTVFDGGSDDHGTHVAGIIGAVGGNARANAANILFITAAGNAKSNIDLRPSYPVLRQRQRHCRRCHHQHGPARVLLQLPGNLGRPPRARRAHHVNRAAPIYAATHPGSTAAEIKEKILTFAAETPTPRLVGKTLAQGRLNVSGF